MSSENDNPLSKMNWPAVLAEMPDEDAEPVAYAEIKRGRGDFTTDLYALLQDAVDRGRDIDTICQQLEKAGEPFATTAEDREALEVVIKCTRVTHESIARRREQG